MYWPDDDEWYAADVVGFDAASKQHRLWYHLDEQYESINLAEEEREGRVQWLPQVDAQFWPPKKVPPASAKPAAAATAAAAGGPSNAPTPGGTVPAAAGTPGDAGQGVQAGDGDTEMGEEAVKAPAGRKAREGSSERKQPAEKEKQKEPAGPTPAAAPTPPAPAAAPPAPSAAPSPPTPPPLPPAPSLAPREVPPTVQVICNGMQATFNVPRMDVTLTDGSSVSPTEFERLAGKGASKKWKVRSGGGKGGQG